jgi:hypothetical protein
MSCSPVFCATASSNVFYVVNRAWSVLLVCLAAVPPWLAGHLWVRVMWMRCGCMAPSRPQPLSHSRTAHQAGHASARCAADAFLNSRCSVTVPHMMRATAVANMLGCCGSVQIVIKSSACMCRRRCCCCCRWCLLLIPTLRSTCCCMV